MSRTVARLVCLSAAVFSLSTAACFALAKTTPAKVRIVLDPGHGGKPERCSARGGAHFDPYTKRFLNFYRYGASRLVGGRRVDEHVVVLRLARKVRKRLDLTLSDETWPQFVQLVKGVTGSSAEPRRVVVEALLSRDNSYRDHPKRGTATVNKYFRLFDSPDKFPYKDGDQLYPGRLSKMARIKPWLICSLHINGSSSQKPRGIHTLFVPSYAHFQKVRNVILARKGFGTLARGPIYRCWFKHDWTRSKLQWMFNDSWTYFTGYGCNRTGGTVNKSTDIGVRQNDILWAYATRPRPKTRINSLAGPFTGPFWQREASAFETRRRAGGLEGYGGDNLYAGQELLRFLRMALWREYKGSPRAKSHPMSIRRYLGRPHRPTAADWAVPLFSNAIAPFIELGYISNDVDFWLLQNKLDVMADGLAVGLYSLCAGTKPSKDLVGLDVIPRGSAIVWDGYRMESGSTYFDAAIGHLETKIIDTIR